MSEPETHRSDPWLPHVLFVVAVWAAARIVMALTHPDPSLAFGHDASYLWIVARNVLEGVGFVNDAHWLIFLHPDELPIPYHNAAPLYPWLVSWMARIPGLDLVSAGYLINAVAGISLVFAVAWLLRHFSVARSSAVAMGLIVALFEPVATVTILYGTNALPLLFGVLTFAAALSKVRFAALLAGAFFGLAWLSRSDAILLLPALALYLAVRDGLRPAAGRLIAMGASAAAVASPWLLHTWRVWGDPLRSDSPYYLVQDFVAIRVQGITVWELWHSLEPPEGLLSVVAAHPAEFIAHVAAGVPSVVIHALADWARLSIPIAGVLAVTGGIGAVVMVRRYPLETFALAVLAATHVALWAIRSLTFETRYFSILALFFGLVCCVGFHAIASRLRRGPRPGLAVGLLTTAAAATLLIPSVSNALNLRSPNPEVLAHDEFYSAVDAAATDGGPVVVGDKPYYFTRLTERSSLSIPYSDDAYLLEFMQKYGARHVALTDAEIQFWKPEWLEGGLPDFLEPVEGLPSHVFRLVGDRP